MRLSDYNSCKNNLLTVGNILAPDEKVQESLVRVLEEMEQDLPDESQQKNILEQLIMTILEGSRYGLWPQD